MKEERASGRIIKIITTRGYNGWTLDAPRVPPSLLSLMFEERFIKYSRVRLAAVLSRSTMCKYRGFVAAARPNRKNEILR